MKKYLCMAAAGMLLFSACSNEDDVINNGNSSADFEGQELIMKVVNTGDGLTTRAARPLYSSEAGQKIDKVKLAIFKLNGLAIESCVFEKTFDDWQNDGQNYGGDPDNKSDHGKYASLNLKKEINPDELTNKGLAPGDYMVYAVGYNSVSSVYTYDPGLINIVKDWGEAAKFKSIKASTNGDAEEIFAGSIAKITVGNDRNFTIVADKPDNNILYLHRQVAGAFGYFMNIPAVGPDGTKATHLRLVAADKNMTVNMTKFNTDFRVSNNNVKYVVNGETSGTSDAKFKEGSDGFVVYNIKLEDWFTAGDSNNDGVLGKNDTWDIPQTIKDKGEFDAIPGTVFAGEFVIPFANKNANTFELQLVSGEDKTATILRTWTVNLKTKQTDVVGLENDTEIANESVSSYSIVRNHLYTIGRKDVAKPTDPTDPTDPENPEDLSKGQILTLRVNDNWEVINQLDIEPEI